MLLKIVVLPVILKNKNKISNVPVGIDNFVVDSPALVVLVKSKRSIKVLLRTIRRQNAR